MAKRRKYPILTSNIVEIAVANLFGYRRFAIVPNVSWGWLLPYEADMIIVDRSTYKVTEVEIKVSLSDLKADFGKKKHRLGVDGSWIPPDRVGRLYYCVPEGMLEKAKQLIPEHFGIIAVNLEPLGKFTYWKA